MLYERVETVTILTVARVVNGARARGQIETSFTRCAKRPAGMDARVYLLHSRAGRRPSTNLEEVGERSETGGGNYGRYGLIAGYQTPAMRP